MRLQREYTGEEITVSAADLLGAGGEARILSVVSHPTLVAKLYHRPGPTQALKLSAMLANPPEDPMADQSHISIAWPVDRLTTTSNPHFVGYLMPRVGGALPVFQYYNPASRRKYAPLFTYQYLLRAARNLAAAVRALHIRGYVIGDLNESNILVTSTALVTLVDTDSFQVPDARSKSVYRCTVGKPEYTPPEIQGLSFAEIDRTPEHDLFGLAILLFQLLMEGTHPFAGEYISSGDPPPYDDRISSGHFPHGSHRTPYLPARSAPPINLLHPTLKSLMVRCFEDGSRDPRARPDAQTWLTALQEAEKQLQTCTINPQHSYGRHLSSCPWCERKLLLAGRDPFPSRAEAERERYLTVRRSTTGFVVNSTYQPAPGAPQYSPVVSVPSGSVPLHPIGSAFKAVFTAQFPPANKWSWAALALTLAAIGAYLVGVPSISLICCAGYASSALASAAVRSRRSGAWLAAICLPPALLAALDSGIDIRDLHFPTAERVVSLVSGVRSAAFSPNGKYIVTGTNRAEDQRLIGGEVQEWDVKTGRLVQTLTQYSGSIASLTFTPNSQSVAVASYGPMGAASVDLVDTRFVDVKTPLETAPPGQPSEALSPDGRTIAVGSLNGSIDLRDVSTHQLRRHIRAKGEVLALAFSPDGRSIAVAAGSAPGSIVSGTVTLFSTESGAVLWREPCHGNAVLAVAFSPDGEYVASGGNDSWLKVWDAVTGKLSQEHEISTRRIATIAFSPNGKLVATAMEPGSTTDNRFDVLVFDFATWRQVRKLSGHTERVTCVAFSPDGQTLASGGLDSTLRLWKLNGH